MGVEFYWGLIAGVAIGAILFAPLAALWFDIAWFRRR